MSAFDPKAVIPLMLSFPKISSAQIRAMRQNQLCVPKTSPAENLGFDGEISLFLNKISLFRRNNSLFCCVGNFAASL